MLAQAKNYMRNHSILTQTESAFIDFSKKTIPDHATLSYERMYEAYKKKDRVGLMKSLSIPLYDVW